MDRKVEFRERTKAYASVIIRLYCELPRQRAEVSILGRQMLRSGTSVAANYREASRARSRVEFVAKIEQCAQEADETQLWLELLRDDCGIRFQALDRLLQETDELIAIFVTMSRNTKQAAKLKPETRHETGNRKPEIRNLKSDRKPETGPET